MEGRRKRESLTRAWFWEAGDYWGQRVEDGFPYVHWDGSVLAWRSIEAERYVFSVYQAGYLVGSSIVDVYPRSMLPELRRRESLSMVGPLFSDEATQDIALGESIRVEGDHPASVFLALMEAGRSVGLPTYVVPENARLGYIFGRRYMAKDREKPACAGLRLSPLS